MTSERAQRTRSVGPVLEAGEIAQAVVTAIRQLNDPVVVEERGSYLRVLVPGRCELTREAVEQHLSRTFRLPGDLESVMPSFTGVFSVSEEKAAWDIEGPS